ncbi:hypothetical protein PR202_ga01464 [Eleusine coracana subsp. coracana]|uniref:Uncharacterized protein n=1 Tax=Eleusine coracana subsp. coracana TaxID=191504 RepID=A0AAV5BF05_ELECO|nr:hypothetical protein PR202_ga00777 [Eleusine coracana subsp. coracana]GJM85677.1 hypothetical protein PR202_ga01464 [Eleusine coracana subsp. coracana]
MFLQLRDHIAQDQEKSDASKSQMEQLKAKIQGIENDILRMETSLDELRRLQGQINTKATERSTLFTLQQQQYAALSEENEDTDEELMEWQTKFEERIALLETKISKLGREMDDEAISSSSLTQSVNEQIELERKTQALGGKNYDSIINQKRTEIYGLDQKLKILQREKDIINRDSDDRVKLGLKKDALESSRQKRNEMYISFVHLLLFSYYAYAVLLPPT